MKGKSKSNLALYSINNKYIEYLKRFDSKVLENYHQSGKLRPYIGIIILGKKFDYFIPLSHPRKKHLEMSELKIDIFKLDNGRLGILNINNMIPIPKDKNVVEKMDLNLNICKTIEEFKYKNLLRNQFIFINNNQKKIKMKVEDFYSKYKKKNYSLMF